jgi:hypothetical protein
MHFQGKLFIAGVGHLRVELSLAPLPRHQLLLDSHCICGQHHPCFSSQIPTRPRPFLFLDLLNHMLLHRRQRCRHASPGQPHPRVDLVALGIYCHGFDLLAVCSFILFFQIRVFEELRIRYLVGVFG